MTYDIIEKHDDIPLQEESGKQKKINNLSIQRRKYWNSGFAHPSHTMVKMTIDV